MEKETQKHPFKEQQDRAISLLEANITSNFLSETHQNPIKTVVVTRDNQYILSGSDDRTIAMWSLKDKVLIHRFTDVHTAPINSIAITRDNKFFVSASDDMSIGIWDLQNQQLLYRIQDAHTKDVLSVTITEDDRYIVSGSEDKTFAIWDMKDKKLLYRIEKLQNDAVVAVVVTNDIKYILAGSADHSIVMWDMEEKKLAHRFVGAHTKRMRSLAVTRDNRYLVSASADRTIAIWSLEEKKLVYRFDAAHKDWIFSVAVTGDNKYIVSGSKDKEIAIWDMQRKMLLHRFQNVHDSEVNSVTLSEDGKFLISGSADKKIGIWVLEETKLVYRFVDAHKDWIYAVAVTRDSKYIVTGSKDNTVAIWDMSEKKLVHRFEDAHKHFVRSVGITADNKIVVSSAAEKDKSIAVWSVEDKALIHRFEEAHKDIIYGVSVTANGEYVVSGSKDKAVGIWSIKEKKLIHRFVDAHRDIIWAVAVSGDGKYIASGGKDNALILYDLQEKKILHRFEDAHNGWVNAVAISRDNKYIVTGSADKGFGIWDILQTKLIHRIDNAHTVDINGIAITPDNDYIITGSDDRTLGVWDMQEKKLLYRFYAAHIGWIPGVTVTDDRNYVISGSGDKSIAIHKINHDTFYTDKDLNFIPLRSFVHNAYSKAISGLHVLTDIDIRLLSEMNFRSTEWNALNFLVFALPNVSNPKELLEIAIDQKQFISIDKKRKTILDYLLEYKEKDGTFTVAVHEFYSYFFKNISRFLNLNAWNYEDIISCISRMSVVERVHSEMPKLSLLSYLGCFCVDAEQGLRGYENLPKEGIIPSGKRLEFAKLINLTIPTNSTDSYSSAVVHKKNQAGFQGIAEHKFCSTIEYQVVLLPLSYDLGAKDTYTLLNILYDFEVEERVLFEMPSIINIIGLLWQRSKPYLWFQVVFFASLVALFTAFSVYRSDEAHYTACTGLLIAILVMNGFALTFEFLQASAGLTEFIRDPWNLIELATILFQLVTAILFWSVSEIYSQSFFNSVSLLLLYSKLLITLRVIDQLRHFVRMILQIVEDSLGFMLVIATYAFAMSFVVYSNRAATTDSNYETLPETIYETYALALGNWSTSNYTGLDILFVVIATYFEILVLLNMLIALMNDTYGRVQDNKIAYDGREKLGMIYEIVSANLQFRKLFCCHRNFREEKPFYMLVAKEFELKSQEDMTLEESTNILSNRIGKLENEFRSYVHEELNRIVYDRTEELKDRMIFVKTEVRKEMDSFKTDLLMKMQETIRGASLR